MRHLKASPESIELHIVMVLERAITLGKCLSGNMFLFDRVSGRRIGRVDTVSTAVVQRWGSWLLGVSVGEAYHHGIPSWWRRMRLVYYFAMALATRGKCVAQA